MKKIKVYSEVVYLLAIALLSFSVAMISSSGFGVSMIVAPAYILSIKSGFLIFGQAEYVIQAGLFVAFCIVMRKFKPVYLSSFATCVIYGAVLDLWRKLPLFNPDFTKPEDMTMWLRVALFVAGAILTSLSVALFFKTYLYPQVYDFFVKGVSEKFGIKRSLFKTCFDLSCLAAATVMSLLFFGRFVGINFGTLIIAAFNGTVIGLFGNLIDRCFCVVPLFKKFSSYFNINT